MNKILRNTYLLAIISGICLGLSYLNFSEYYQGILAWVAFVPLFLSIREETNFKKYLLKILIVYSLTILIGFWWTGYYKPIAVLVCLVSQILFLNSSFIIHFFIQKRFGWTKAVWVFPFCWTISEYIQHHLPHNLQVLALGYTQADLLYFNQFADFTGVWGISFWVVMLNVLLAFSIYFKQKKYWFLSFLWLFMALAYSIWILKINPQSAIGKANLKTKVSLIQTNIDSYATNDSLIVDKTLKQILTLSDSAVKKHQPDLLILPEAAFPFSFFKDTAFFQFARYKVLEWQTPIAVGYADFNDEKKSFKNLATVFTPQLAYMWDSLKIKETDVMVYQKQYGLPFSESMPYCADCQSFRNMKLESGNEPYIFTFANNNGDKFRTALTICWEQTYPEKMTSLVNQNIDFVALMNNDSWFGTTPGAKYLLNFTKLRAIENRKTIARCSNGGISSFIDPFGRIYGEIPWFSINSSTQEVLCTSKKSFYTKHPQFFIVFISIAFIVILLYFQIKFSAKSDF